MNTNQNNPFGSNLFTEDKLNYIYKSYLKNEIKECDRRIRDAKEVLILEQCLPENRTLAQREYEVFTYRKFQLHIQLEGLESPWLRSEQLGKIVEGKLRNEEANLKIKEWVKETNDYLHDYSELFNMLNEKDS